MTVYYYIYAGDIYCEKCAQALMDRLRHDFPDDPDDSDVWPQGPFRDGESDTPQHCGSHHECLDPTILPSGSTVGRFLEVDLTDEGEEYVKERHRERPTEVTQMWMDVYRLSPPLTINQRRSRLRARLEELSSEDAFQIVDTLVMTVLGCTLEDGELDSLSDCACQLLDDLHNHGLDPTRF